MKNFKFLGMYITLNDYHNRMKNKKEKLVLYRVIMMFNDGLSELYNFVKDYEDLERQIKLYSTYEIDLKEVKKAWDENKC